MDKRTEIKDLGEFGLIDRLTKNIKLRNVTSKIGVGDDAAVIDGEFDDITDRGDARRQRQQANQFNQVPQSS